MSDPIRDLVAKWREHANYLWAAGGASGKDDADIVRAMAGELESVMAVPGRPTRWHDGMREWEGFEREGVFGFCCEQAPTPKLCWAYVSDDIVCIRERGHDNGAHEPSQVNAGREGRAVSQ